MICFLSAIPLLRRFLYFLLVIFQSICSSISLMATYSIASPFMLVLEIITCIIQSSKFDFKLWFLRPQNLLEICLFCQPVRQQFQTHRHHQDKIHPRSQTHLSASPPPLEQDSSPVISNRILDSFTSSSSCPQ